LVMRPSVGLIRPKDGGAVCGGFVRKWFSRALFKPGTPLPYSVPCYNVNMLTFAAALRQTPLPLFQAGLCFAQEIAYPDLDILEYLDKLDELERVARTELATVADPLERAEWLAEYLFWEQGFRGNQEKYDDPRNSYLNELLDRKLGIPISLSVLYLALAERLDIPASGVGLPGHFVVAVRTGDKRLLLDPFHRGRVLSLRDCAQLVTDTTGYQGVFQAEWLTPISPRIILGRMLNNLRLLYLQQDQAELALAVLDRLALVDPHDPTLIRDRGVIYFQRGRVHQAMSYLDQYARLAPDAPDTLWLKEQIDEHIQGWVRQN